jgi:hypothetical protein
MDIINLDTNPPPPGGTAILPEYIHYYGYYYQVIVHIITGVSPPHFNFVVFYYVLCQCQGTSSRYDMSIIIYLFEFQLPMCSLNTEFLNF